MCSRHLIFFENHPQDPTQAADAARRRAGLPEDRSALAHAFRRRSAADQAGTRTGQEEHRADAVPAGRTDDRSALCRHRDAAEGLAWFRRCGQHGRGGRAQSGCDQDGRLDHRPGARRRCRGRPDRRRRHARRDRSLLQRFAYRSRAESRALEPRDAVAIKKATTRTRVDVRQGEAAQSRRFGSEAPGNTTCAMST